MATGDVTLNCHDAGGARARLDALYDIAGEVYAEPPYYEGPDDAADFRERTERQISQRGFELVTAQAEDRIVGFSFGFTLPPDTGWWDDLVTPLRRELTEEWDGRTFALIELIVRAPWRRRGVGRALHDALLADRPEERATLCASPEAESAQAAYASWGWRKVGEKPLPLAGNPVYDVLVLPLTSQSSQAEG